MYFFYTPDFRWKKDRREPEDPGGLLHDGLHQPRLPHHGQVRAGRQGAEGRPLRHVVVVIQGKTSSTEWVGVGRIIDRIMSQNWSRY